MAGKEPALPKGNPSKTRRTLISVAIVAVVVALGGTGAWYWRQLQVDALPSGVAKANGRLESDQVEVATKYQGRIATVLVREGDMVDAGQVVARMDTAELEAQLHGAEADVHRAEHEKAQAEAIIAQRDSERTFARQELQRTSTLFDKGWSTGEKLDLRRNEIRTAQAAYDTAVAGLDAAKAQILAAQAEVARLKTQIDDSTLSAPRRGRVQSKLAEPGEVLSAGGQVLLLRDLTQVYLSIFVPIEVASSLNLGDEARVTLDPLPGYVFPATVTFIATGAPFAPTSVEASDGRSGLMSHVQLTIDPELKKRYESRVKTALRGVGFVRTEPDASWPDRLSVRLP
ncbi:MAG: efflux RND transporter periplasmic adaptor subunit [Hyphomicrobiales bacterium]|nr:efflux RND transporter periplasmic adaptor subunit [Hyphomicrobiales bacterium]